MTYLELAAEPATGRVTEEIRREIGDVVGAGGLISEFAQLRVYECDGLTGFWVTSALVVLPATTEEVAAVVRVCACERIPFVARGAGTGLSGGPWPFTGRAAQRQLRFRRGAGVFRLAPALGRARWSGLMGGSAFREAEFRRRRAEALRKAARFEMEAAVRFELAGRTEERVAAEVAAMSTWGWRFLADRRWPVARAANIDLVLIGPGGVLVVDVKAWAEPQVIRGRLYRGQAPADEEVDTLLRMTGTVEEVAAAAGLAPQLVVPLIVLAGRDDPAVRLGRVWMVGADRLAHWVASRPPGVTPERVEQLTAAIAEALPAYQAPVPQQVSIAIPQPPLPREQPVPAGGQLALVDTDELAEALLAAEAAKPIEEWMTFLHPAQTAVVRRSWHGPARIRGPAGTGKTVVALHRAAYLAATRPGRILLTGFVKTLPEVLRNLYLHLSPDTTGRVEFVSLNAWAHRFLRQRQARVHIDPGRNARLWQEAWSLIGARSRLVRLVPDQAYWREEIDHVIKARGLREYPEYAGADRPGRRVALQREHKSAVWDLYVAYQQRLTDAGLLDFNDVLAVAIEEINRQPPEPGYTAVIVDEVSDLNLLGLRLVRQLSGDGPDALLLVGDGRQAVYPGGARLQDAGIDVSGRAVVLRVNYRNTDQVLHASRMLTPTGPGAPAASADPDDGGYAEVARPDGRDATWIHTRNLNAHNTALLSGLRQAAERLGGYAGLAVLCHTRRHVDDYLRLLTDNTIPCLPLEHYTGVPVDRVKVGTYKRAKGLDFAAVFLPRIPPPTSPDRSGNPATAERAELRNREIHVAATRARDELWLGRLGW